MIALQAIATESLKLKRTLAFWLALLAPLLVVALQVLMAYDRTLYIAEGENPWKMYAQGALVIWSLLMLPLFVTLETALVAQLEHANGGWKLLYALPVPRWAIYLGKQFASMALLALSWAMLLVWVVLGGWLLNLVRPELLGGWPVPWKDLLIWASMAYLCSWLLISIHTWVGLRFKSFIVALGFGIAMTVIGVVVINHELASYYPWTMTTLVANGFIEGNTMLNLGRDMPITELLCGALGGVAVALLGGWDVSRREAL